MQKLQSLLAELESNIVKHEFSAANISSSPVGWHIEHSLLTIDIIMDALKNSNPADYAWKFNWKRSYVFILKKFPRGRAKSPVSVQPVLEINTEMLYKHLADTKAKILALNTLSPNQHFKHPIFGKLNVKPTIRFLSIHTHHHLKIINDIILEADKSL